MGKLNPHRSCHVVLEFPNCHPTGIQADDHVIDVSQTPRAFRNHSRWECSSPISRDINSYRPVVGTHGFRVGAVSVIFFPSCRFAAPVARLVAEMGVHVSIQSPSIRGL